MKRSVNALMRAIEDWWEATIQKGIPAAALRDQLPPNVIPPTGNTGQGYTPDPDAVTRVGVRKNSAGSVYSRRCLNFIEGTDTSISIADDSGNEEVDITITSGAGGGSGNVTDAGAVGGEPGTPNTGDLYFTNVSLERFDSTWQSWGPIYALHDPLALSWSWINQGGASVDVSNGGIYILAPASASQSIRARVKAQPTAPYVIDIAWLPLIYPADYGLVSLGWRESGSGKLSHIRYGWVSGVWQFAFIHSTGATTDAAAVASITFGRSAPLFVRLQDDSTNHKVFISEDGQHWLLLYSESRTAYLTADQVFFGADSRNGSHDCGVTILSWYEH